MQASLFTFPASTGLNRGEKEDERVFPGINLGLNLQSRHKPGTDKGKRGGRSEGERVLAKRPEVHIHVPGITASDEKMKERELLRGKERE